MFTIFGPHSAQELTKWSGALFLAAVEAFIIWNLVFNARKWDLSRLLCAEDGAASMSRFQLMLFTFAIVGGYFYLTIQYGKFPEVDQGAIGLLGISGGTYAISKGIQASRDTSPTGPGAAPPAQVPGAPVVPAPVVPAAPAPLGAAGAAAPPAPGALARP